MRRLTGPPWCCNDNLTSSKWILCVEGANLRNEKRIRGMKMRRRKKDGEENVVVRAETTDAGCGCLSERATTWRRRLSRTDCSSRCLALPLHFQSCNLSAGSRHQFKAVLEQSLMHCFILSGEFTTTSMGKIIRSKSVEFSDPGYSACSYK